MFPHLGQEEYFDTYDRLNERSHDEDKARNRDKVIVGKARRDAWIRRNNCNGVNYGRLF